MEPTALATNWAEIDLDAIENNVRELRRRSGPGVRLMAVVKGNGYGHCSTVVAEVCREAGADWLGVANVWEGAVLREAGVGGPILVLGPTRPEAAWCAVASGLSLAVFDRELVAAVSRAAVGQGKECGMHVKVDSGMSRIGLRCEEEVVALAREISATAGVFLEGTFTHLASSEEEDRSPSDRQFRRFREHLAALEGAGISPGLVHVCNSGGTIGLTDMAFHMVRPGLSIYGYYPAAGHRSLVDLRPAMTWKTRVVQIKVVPAGVGVSYGLTHHTEGETVLASLPVGYGDGFRRLWSNRGHVLVHGQRVPVVGRVCMDQTVVDVTGVEAMTGKEVRTGDEVVLIGRQGEEEISADEWAEKLDTVIQEVLTLIGPRTLRLFRREGRVVAVSPALSGCGRVELT